MRIILHVINFISHLLIYSGSIIDYYAPPCSDVFSDVQTGTIRLPTTIDGTYSPFMSCRWEITAPPHHSIVLVSSDFAVEDSNNCQWDHVEVRDGNESTTTGYRFCGYQQLAYLSQSSSVFVYFTSDALYQDRGFVLHFYVVDNDARDTSMCNRTIDREMYITSPNYPSRNPPNALCLYRIQASPGHHAVLSIEEIQLDDENCLHDNVEIFDGETSHDNSLGRPCINDNPASFTSSNESLLVLFTSDYFQERKGFRAFVSFIQTRKGNTQDLTGCDLNITTQMEGTISSPNYPFNYPNKKDCAITIWAPLPDHQVRLNITVLDMEESENCSFDYLAIVGTRGQHNPKLCGYRNSSLVYQSSTEIMQIRFHSDDFITERGFHASFTVVPKDVCFPVCSKGSICVYKEPAYSCTRGTACPLNICGNGTCVVPTPEENSITIQCYCNHGYGGTFCDKILEDSDRIGLSMTVFPESRSVRKGSDLMLECKANKLNVDYTWLFGDLMLQSNGHDVQIHNDGLLQLRDFMEDMEGMYTCLASTSTEFIKHQFRLTLMEPCNIVVEVPPRNKSVEVGNSALFSCVVPSVDKVVWSINGMKILPGDERVEILANGYYLKIEATREDDEGTYTCMAESQDGCYVERSAYLYVNPVVTENHVCGRIISEPRVPSILSSRISGGDVVSKASSPWHVIINENKLGKTFCGGTIISNKWIVTAAHCIVRFPEKFHELFHPSKVTLIIGTEQCSGDDGQIVDIESYVVHPRFAERAPYDHDIALIELRQDLNFTERVQPICLKQSDYVNTAFLHRKVGRKAGRVVGCGQLYENVDAIPTELHDVFVPTVTREKCMEADIGRGNFTDTMFCAGYDRALFGDACYGDSGGSLAMNDSPFDPWVLVGVVSWGVGCDRQGHYGYYTNVAHFYNWIQNVTNV